MEDQEFDVLLQTGIPIQLLSNRPDVQEAEYQLRYNFEQIKNAKAYFYPSIAKAQYDENVANFYSTLLGAGQEVSNALFSYQMAEEKTSSRDEQLLALSKAVDYNRELLNYGYAQTSYLDVLTSHQSYLIAQLNQVNDQLQKLVAVVNLYQSLGGGWK